MTFFFSWLHDFIIKKHDVKLSYVEFSPILSNQSYNISTKYFIIDYKLDYSE
jgi:hypothetical protein